MSKSSKESDKTKTTPQTQTPADPPPGDTGNGVTNNDLESTTMMIDNEEKEEDTLRKSISLHILDDMYRNIDIMETPRLQIAGFNKLNLNPVCYVATMIDCSKKLCVIIDSKYSKQIFAYDIKENDVVDVHQFTFQEYNTMVFLKVVSMTKVGSIPPLRPVPGIILRRTNNINYNNSYQRMTANTTYNKYNNNNNNSKTGYTNVVDPLRGGYESIRDRIQHNTAQGSMHGYGPARSSRTDATLNGPMVFHEQLGTGVTLSNLAHKVQANLKKTAMQVDDNDNSNDNSNTNNNVNSNSNNNNENSNSNSNSNTNENVASSAIYQDKEYMTRLRSILKPNMVPNDAHNNAPADRQLPLKHNMLDDVIPELQAAGHLNQDQAEYLRDVINSQSQKVPAYQAKNNAPRNVQDLLRKQRDPEVTAMS